MEEHRARRVTTAILPVRRHLVLPHHTSSHPNLFTPFLLMRTTHNRSITPNTPLPPRKILHMALRNPRTFLICILVLSEMVFSTIMNVVASSLEVSLRLLLVSIMIRPSMMFGDDGKLRHPFIPLEGNSQSLPLCGPAPLSLSFSLYFFGSLLIGRLLTG